MNISLRDLLDAGVHFGHQLRRFNPKSKPYIFDVRHGITIVDLEKTYACLERACEFVEGLVASGKDIMFVGTKRQAQEIIREAATACQMPFAAGRWMGGGLTNFETIKSSLKKYREFLEMDNDGRLARLHKKEGAAIRRRMTRMNRNFEGFLNLQAHPAALFVVDTKTEYIAVAEANRLGIPVVALVDTNSDPTKVDYPIPGNDDAIKAIRIIVEAVMEAALNGLAQRHARQGGGRGPADGGILAAATAYAPATGVALEEAPANVAIAEQAPAGEDIPVSFSSEDTGETPPPPAPEEGGEKA